VLGIGEAGFDALRAASSWCTDNKDDEHDEEGEPTQLGAEERALTGRRCKRILDAGRLWWLKSELGLGMEGEIVEYVQAETSLENALLLAWPSA
jgi:tRNA:m4X modification enzyme